MFCFVAMAASCNPSTTSPDRRDSDSDSSACGFGSTDFKYGINMACAHMYKISLPWKVFEKLTDDSDMDVDGVIVGALYGFSKSILSIGLKASERYYTNVYDLVDDDEISWIYVVAGPFPESGPANLCDRILHLLQNALIDYANSQGENINIICIQKFTVKKLETDYEVIERRHRRPRLRRSHAINNLDGTD